MKTNDIEDNLSKTLGFVDLDVARQQSWRLCVRPARDVAMSMPSSSSSIGIVRNLTWDSIGSW
jgi:hypothetical protein